MHHQVFGINVLLHSANLFYHLPPPSHHPSLPLSSIPDLKHRPTYSTNSSHHRSSATHWTPTGLPIHGLRTAQRVDLVFPLSSFTSRLGKIKLHAFGHFLIIRNLTKKTISFVHSFIHKIKLTFHLSMVKRYAD